MRKLAEMARRHLPIVPRHDKMNLKIQLYLYSLISKPYYGVPSVKLFRGQK